MQHKISRGDRFPGHALLRVLLSCMSPPQYKTRQKTLSPDSQFSHHTKPNKRLFSWANRIIAIFSAQPNALKRWQRAYYRAFLRFLPGLWADSRRSFPRTQLAFSIWVPGPLLHPYSQNTYSRHRNQSNSQHIRTSQLMASLSAQPPRMSARVTDITGLDKPICPTARAHFAPNGYSQTEYHRPLLQKKADAEQNCLSAVLSGVCLCLFFIQEFPYSV